MTFKQAVVRMYTTVTTIAVVLVLMVAGSCLREYIQPIDEYFKHYGNISVSEAFVYPEEVKLYSFGDSAPGIELNIVNKLWCVSADSISREWILIGTLYDSVDNESTILNSLPNAVTALPITEESPASDLGVSDRYKFQKLSSRGYNFYEWSMGDMRPTVASSCYVETKITVDSTIYSLPKSITFKSGEFAYLYDI